MLRHAPRRLLQVFTRRASTAANQLDAAKYRNIALVAHIDSGKTTLTESILHASSYLTQAGSVDTGSTTTDFLPAERQRGITIQSASIPVTWKDWCFNLVDTPGHADFGMEVESASRVVDGAVVLIDSVQGVEPQTKGVWKQLDRYGVPGRLMFFNKLDRAGASYRASFDSLLTNRLHPKPVPITLPIASFDAQDYQLAEPGVSGLVDLVKWEVWRWSGEDFTRVPLPPSKDAIVSSGILPPDHPLIEHLIPARISLLDTISMGSESLMEHLLDLSSTDAWAAIPGSQILPHLRDLTITGSILPVFCGSAAKHIGTKLLMDYIGELLPSPSDRKTGITHVSTSVQMLAWKVVWDKRKGWMTFVRIYSGTLTSRAKLMNKTRNEKESVSKLLLLYANREVEVDSLPFGSVGVVLGLKHTRTGDTLHGSEKGSKEDTNVLSSIIPPPSVISASVIPASHSEEQAVQTAISSLTRTDPSVRSEVVDGQILIHALGALHLEIIEGRLRDEWDANFELGPRRVTYRESLSNAEPVVYTGTWQADVQGAKVPVDLSFSIRPLNESSSEAGLPEWNGNVVVKRHGTAIPAPISGKLHSSVSDETFIAQGISNALATSPHTSLEYTRNHITLLSYNLPAQTPPGYLTGATTHILRSAFLEAGLGSILEPYIRLKVSVDEHHLGAAIRDITDHNGEILDYEEVTGESTFPFESEGLYRPPQWLTPCSGSSNAAGSAVVKMKRGVLALAPLAQFLDYAQRLRAATGGHGLFESMNAGYKVVNPLRRKEILVEMGKLRPE